MRIGVVTDTHVGDLMPGLPEAVGEALGDVELILHAGDLTDRAVLGVLGEIAPVVAVRGNHDRGPGARMLPMRVLVRAGGLRIGLTHGHRPFVPELATGLASLVAGRPLVDGFQRAARRRFGDVDVVVVGHMHVPMHRMVEGALVFSPGAVYVAEADPSFRWDRLRGRLYRRHRAGLPASALVPAVGVIETGPGGLRALRLPLIRGAPG